jgi:hypothetical protein
MTKLNLKYSEYQTYVDNNSEWKQEDLEFPTFYMYLLYESGGDFKTYSKILGYENYEEFINDYNEIIKNEKI